MITDRFLLSSCKVLLVLLLNGYALHALETGLIVKNGELKQINGQPTIEFPVVLTATQLEVVEFEYKTSDGTAKAGKDYLATSGKVSIPAKELKTSIIVPILNTSQSAKTSKNFYLTISSKLYTVFTDKAVGSIPVNTIAKETALKPSLQKDKQ